MSCENCYNGCPDPTPDKCVKYTGIDIEALDISTGDPLSLVLDKMTTAITEMFKGNGIIPRVEPADICDLIYSYLPCCDPIDLNVLLTAIVKAICDIEARINFMRNEIDTLNGNYDVDCLTGVTDSSDTHDVLQASILKLCIVANDLAATKLDLSTNYVLKSEIDGYIQTYLSGIPATTDQSGKMIPYVIYPYFGDTTGIFDITGAGLGLWAKVYLCNGDHGTPDLRGLVLVGATNMGTEDYADQVNPNIPGNPTYNAFKLGGSASIQGANRIVLIPLQIPSHSHGATVTINDPGHTHSYNEPVFEFKADFSTNERVWRGVTQVKSVTPQVTGLKGGDGVIITDPPQNVFVSIGPSGGGEAHDNYQPGVGINYIMFIP